MTSDNEKGTGMTLIDEGRLALVKDLPLTRGSHDFVDGQSCPDGMCAVEFHNWIRGLEFNDRAQDMSPVVAEFIRRFNDGIDAEGLERLKQWQLDNVARLSATKGDGLDEQRGWLAANHAIRHSLPTWLDLAGATEAAAELRALPEITSKASASKACAAARKVRERMWQLRNEKRKEFIERFKEEMCKRGFSENGDAASSADAAAAAAYAAAAAAAYAAAAAAYDAYDAYDAAAAADAAYDAYDAAAAAAAAAAAYDADAADAAADAAAAASSSERWDAVYKGVKEKLKPIFDAKLDEEARPGYKDAGFELLEALVAIGEVS